MNATPISRLPKIPVKKSTAKEFWEFAKGKDERYELIDGRIYMMASPNVNHQRIAREILRKVANYLESKPCEPFIAPLDVVLFEKDEETDGSQNVFQPDVFVVCDPEKIADERIYGAPDFIAEIVSPSTSANDYFHKCKVYMQYGVKEYWVINPETKNILVYINGEEVETYSYTFEDKIKVSIFGDFEIDFKNLNIKGE